jgi:hypothetical protein
MNDSAALGFVLKYAAAGLRSLILWPVIKTESGYICKCGKAGCKPGKHPFGKLMPNGLKNATADERTLRKWFDAFPDYNVGIATGGGLVVLDIDPRHRGDAALAQLETRHGKLPHSWRVRTGGGGLHIYMSAPSDILINNSAGHLGEGLDIRATGGYVVAPPSNHESGAMYEWAAGRDLAAMPPWLVAAVQQPRLKFAAPAYDWRDLVRSGLVEGRRNQEVTRLAGHLLRKYVDPHVVLELLQAFNEARGKPPLEPEEVSGRDRR